MTVESAGGSTSSEPAQSSGRALDVGVACPPGLALVLDVAGSPTFTPGCLLLHSIAAFALMIAILAPLSLALAVAVLAPRSLALAVAALPCQRARRRDRLGIGRASWRSLCCGTPPAAPRSRRRREGARGAARSSGSAASSCSTSTERCPSFRHRQETRPTTMQLTTSTIDRPLRNSGVGA